ncbi:hypothetical protein O3M35_011211 [Rhynocoris fuscipes]|uniref:C2H2-type domain-containing protein n=1 Tax=Rhynocoris fuscipes TaxID=488301 RepID=A0AAW1CUX0_9HEMI
MKIQEKHTIQTGWQLKQKFVCLTCGKRYRYDKGLSRHIRFECGKDPQFKCTYCPYEAKRKEHLKTHIINKHPGLISQSEFFTLKSASKVLKHLYH